MSYSTFSPEFTWDNKNIRITARDANNLFGVTNEKGNTSVLFVDKTPARPVKYTYTVVFENYLVEQIPAVYTYTATFDNYLLEETDGSWGPPIEYTYSVVFNNYLVEQIQI